MGAHMCVGLSGSYVASTPRRIRINITFSLEAITPTLQYAANGATLGGFDTAVTCLQYGSRNKAVIHHLTLTLKP